MPARFGRARFAEPNALHSDGRRRSAQGSVACHMDGPTLTGFRRNVYLGPKVHLPHLRHALTTRKGGPRWDRQSCTLR